ncbi:hypothetical protein F5Y04DRAFT_109292 [Hypomontagnella monticulosa]|nr:hypothetical protein F5Y04DRAFT_109292 [Hypomontagnella monticulosa]
MMPSLLGPNMGHLPPQNYSSDPTFDELSRQLLMSDSIRRISRPTGQRTAGTMRVVKPSSANNSPQAMMARRRTMMNDSNLARRRQQVLDQAVLQQMQECTAYSTPEDSIKRNNRPVSWHPSSHQQPQMHIPMPQPDFSQYVVPTPMTYHQPDLYSGYQNLPPTPAVYSGQTSPLSTVSPLCLPYAAPSQPQAAPAYISQDTWNAAQFIPNYASSGSPEETEPFPSFTMGQGAFDWDGGLAAQGFPMCTAPPTPDEFQPVQQSQPTVPPEESIPYQPLEEPEEEEGEILVGMGLYDPPNKTESDPGLDNYRTTTSQLLGTTYRRGQGWKLEEAWEPPASDDEEDGEGDGEEEEAEKDKATESTTAEQNWI